MLTYVKKWFKEDSEKKIKPYLKLVEEINSLEETIEKLSDIELQSKTIEFKERLLNGESLESIKCEAFAVVREAAKRILGQRHYDVQLIGGLTLHDGNIAEMATGEGKTLVASLPSYLNALTGKGVHVITVNDYLAKRDKELIGQVHEFLGLTVGLNIPQMSTDEKQQSYNADITYGVGNEFGFDYLRDHMVNDVSHRVQRPFSFAIIDEVDSVLIDEAKTPLIIAGKANVSSNLFNICAKVVKRFKRDEDFMYDPLTKTVSLSEQGVTKIERTFGIDNLYDLEHQTLFHYVNQSLKAEITLRRDVDYIVSEGKILLVDIFTGRVMDGRSYSDGLQQAIEAKEGLVITDENKTQATVTIQNYFRMYPKLSGMTGTAKSEEKEFQMVYNMDVIPIPTNKTKLRIDDEDRVFLTREQKYSAVVEEVSKFHSMGVPVLIGTASIEQSEILAGYLKRANLEFNLLNAKSVEKEAQLISMAGLRSQITIATNMAGRGTDIILGEGIAALGGLHVIGTERHESIRVDNQLRGRAGRQGDPGRSQFLISLEDELFERYGEEETTKLSKKVKTSDNGEITNDNIFEFVDKIQKICEASNASMRDYTLKLDSSLNEHRQNIYKFRTKAIESTQIVEFVLPLIENHVKETLNTTLKESLVDFSMLKEELEKILPLNSEIRWDDEADIAEKVERDLNRYIKSLYPFTKNDMFSAQLKQFILGTIDRQWLDHIEAMTRLKEGIGLRSYSQEDPIRIFERESYGLFLKTYAAIEENIGTYVFSVTKQYEPMEEN